MFKLVRIAFVIDRLSIGGTEGQLALLINGLDVRRFSSYLITTHGQEISYAIECKRFFFPAPKLCSPRLPLAIMDLMRFFRRERIDIVHSFFFDSAVLGTMSGRLARTPVKILSRRDMGFWETPAKRRVMKLVSRMSDRLLVNSESVRRRIVEDEGVPAEKIDVIYNGIDTKPFDKGAPRAQSRAKFNIADNSPVVGIVANLNREVKRVDLFIEAADIVMRKFPTAKFLVAGEGHLRSTLEEKSRSASLNGAVQFLGPEKDIPSLLSALDVAVNCSDSEGLSNAVIEYMAAGLPAVVSNVPGNCELVTDGIEGLHFSAGDAPALADRIKFLLSNSQEAAQMGQRGREKVGRRLSSEVMIQQHMDYYSRLLQDKG